MTLLPFKHKRSMGLVDRTGQVHVAPVYERIERASCGRHGMSRGYRYGYLDATGAEVIAPTHGSYLFPFRHGWAVVKDEAGLCRLIDPDGTSMSSQSYAELHVVSETLVLARLTGTTRLGLMNISDESWQLEPRWEVALPAGTGILVGEGKRWGAVDLQGAELVKPTWARLKANDDGTWLASQKARGPLKLLDPHGAVSCTYAEEIAEMHPFRGLYTAARREKLWGVVDRGGSWVLEPFASGIGEIHPSAPTHVRVGKRFGFITPQDGLVIEATLTWASDFVDGHAVADAHILDTDGKEVARIVPTQSPVIFTPPLPATGRAAKALVALRRRPSKHPPDRAVLEAIAALPDRDVCALLYTWYTSGLPWIQLGPWEIWVNTTGAQIVDALRAGEKRIPFGSGAYGDPLSVVFKRQQAQINIDSNPDDTRPRHFHSFDSFADTMVTDGLAELDDSDAWPLPDWLTSFRDAGGLGETAKTALEAHVVRVSEGTGEHALQAKAWLSEHGTPVPELTLEFVPCDAPSPHPDPPPAIADALRVSGHQFFRQGASGRWVAVTKKGIQFLDKKGKRKPANPGFRGSSWISLVLLDDDAVAHVAADNQALRIDLSSGKKTKLLERSYGQDHAMGFSPNGQQLVCALQGESEGCTELRVFDLEGTALRDISIPETPRVRGIVPLWDALVLLLGSKSVLVVDLAQDTVVGLHDGSIKAVHLETTACIVSTYRGHVELRR